MLVYGKISEKWKPGEPSVFSTGPKVRLLNFGSAVVFSVGTGVGGAVIMIGSGRIGDLLERGWTVMRELISSDGVGISVVVDVVVVEVVVVVVVGDAVDDLA